MASPDDRAGTAARIREHVDALCGFGPDRHPGTESNEAATRFVARVMAESGLAVETLEFDVPSWHPGRASLRGAGVELRMYPSPFSASFSGAGTLVAVSCERELDAIDARDAIVLLHGEIATEQFTPRDYPWYANPEHAAVLDTLEAMGPAAIITATGKNPATTAGMSPFPLIEEVRFSVPSAYLSAEEGHELLARVGTVVEVSIDSKTTPGRGFQPIGRRQGTGAGRVIVAAHVDTKPDTPGALDNAAGVATILAVAQILEDEELACDVEFVPFNGEDHVMSPGEVAYLARYPDVADVRLMINVDDAGLPGGPSAVSTYGLDAVTQALVAQCVSAAGDDVVEGPQWPSSDHMIFAMRGVQSVAVTAWGLETVMGEITHTPLDTPDRVDEGVLADAAYFIASLIRHLGAPAPLG